MDDSTDFFTWPVLDEVQNDVCLTDKTAALLLDYLTLELQQNQLFNDYCAQKDVDSKEAYQQQLSANAQAIHRAALFLVDHVELKLAMESVERPLIVQRLSTVGGLAGLYEKVQQGEGLAATKGRLPKHAKKQVDRMLSNDEINISSCQYNFAKLLISQRKRIFVAMDWTVFAKDHQMTLTFRLITKHGRATLLWQTISTVGLKGHKNEYIFMLFERLRRIVSNDTQVIVIADREFGTLNNMEMLKKNLNFDYILRVKRNFTIIDNVKSIKKLAHEWLDCEKLTCIDDAYITVQEYQVNKVVICKEPDMKDMWCLACSIKNIATKTIITLYGKRWGTETSYRDEKDLQFGFGLKKSRIRNIARRDRLLLLSAIAIIFLTLLGAASEEVGFDKYIKSNTIISRTHSLFSQGRLILKLAPTLKEKWLIPIMDALQRFIDGLGFINNDQYFI